MLETTMASKKTSERMQRMSMDGTLSQWPLLLALTQVRRVRYNTTLHTNHPTTKQKSS